MIPGGGNMKQMMRQVQKMQQQMAKAQEELAQKTVEGTAGGVVKVTVTGDRRVTSITIAPEAVDPDDVEMLQDLILAAINDGMKKAEEMVEAEMRKVLPGGIPKIPGLF